MVIFAEERSCTTQFELGELFYQRNNGSQQYDQALKWFKRAAINGSRQAQHRLGTMYARGHGVAQDYAKAYAWCRVAVLQNSRRARRKLGKIEARMTFRQLSLGRKLARIYYRRFVSPQVH